jgi:shikimate dehydrogenase
MNTTSNTAISLNGHARLPLITGRTRMFGIVADPIYHVKTPEVMNALFCARGVDAVLVPVHVSPEGLGCVLDGLRRTQNFGGFIATVPHKTAMLALCDEASDSAKKVGAVNCVRRDADGRMIGAMFDGIGFVEAIRAGGLRPKGMSVYIAGAGGAAAAIAFALAEAGARHITVANRTIERAAALANRLKHVYPHLSVDNEVDAVDRHDLLVNGTSLGMRANDELPLDVSRLHIRQSVADVVMVPEMTPLLKAASAQGCRLFPGRPMLEAQINLMAGHMGAFD